MIIEKSSTSKKSFPALFQENLFLFLKKRNAISVGKVRKNKNGIELISETTPFFNYDIPEMFTEYILYFVLFILFKRKKKGTLFLFYVELLI
jgi:prolipoprotein diacylglyceryltransferase